MDSKRIAWIDTLKSIGLLVVILGHIANPFSSFIYSWHMPFFFFISGFFIKIEFELRGLLSSIKKDFLRLMMPFFLFSILGLVVEILKRIVLGRDPLNYISELTGIFLQMNLSNLSNHYGFVLWFLSALFFAKCIVSILLYLLKGNAVLVGLASAILFSLSFFVELPFSLGVAFNSSLWVVLGYVYYTKMVAVNQVLQLIFSISFLIAGYVYLKHIPNLDMGNLVYENVYINIIWALGLILLLIFMVKFVSNKFIDSITSNIAKYFMFVFVFHPYTNNIAYLLAMRFSEGEWIFKYFLSLLFIGGLLLIRSKMPRTGVLKYV